MNRNQLKAILKINGLTESATDDEIRAILLSANYSETEIESALVILKDLSTELSSTVEGLHSVMYSNQTLRANEVISLLGIDITLDAPLSFRSKHARIKTTDGLLIIGGSILVAILGILAYMYFYKVGIFYPKIYIQ